MWEKTLTFNSDHVYSYEDMGFTREMIIQMYADLFERFGFDKREPLPVKSEKQSTQIPATD